MRLSQALRIIIMAAAILGALDGVIALIAWLAHSWTLWTLATIALAYLWYRIARTVLAYWRTDLTYRWWLR